MPLLCRLVLFALCTLSVAVSTAASFDIWYPYPIAVYKPTRQVERPYMRLDYMPLQRAEHAWQLCVSLPHLHNAYWLAVNHGLVAEARRLGVALSLSDAGDYAHPDRQIQGIQDCVAAGGEAVIIAAVDATALDPLVADLRTQQVPVIDLITGMDSPLVNARIRSPSTEMVRQVAEGIVRQHPLGSEAVQVAWFPGPKGAGFVERIHPAFLDTLSRSEAQVVATRYGELEPQVQAQLVREVLDEYPQLGYIVGNAVAVDAALGFLEERDLRSQITVMAYHFTPALLPAIRQGTIAVVPNDSPVILGRIAVDQTVRILEAKPYMSSVGTRVLMLDRSNLDVLEQGVVLAPRDFQPLRRLAAPLLPPDDRP